MIDTGVIVFDDALRVISIETYDVISLQQPCSKHRGAAQKTASDKLKKVRSAKNPESFSLSRRFSLSNRLTECLEQVNFHKTV